MPDDAKPGRFMCPCCGFWGLEVSAYLKLPAGQLVRGLAPPYANHFGMPSYEVCPCCAFEFGNDDDPGGPTKPAQFEPYLAEWKAEGCLWFRPAQKPAGWNLEAQLAAVKP